MIMKLLQALLNREDPVKLKYHQQFIPPAWMTRPHVIVQNFNVLQIIQYGLRRGKEGIADLKVKDFAIKEDEIWGLKSYAKVNKFAFKYYHVFEFLNVGGI